MSGRYGSLMGGPFIRLFLPFAMGYFVSVFIGGVMAVMSPILVDTFSLSAADLGFMSSLYLITFGAVQFPLGVLLDRYGARKTLAPMILFAAVGSVVFASARGFPQLLFSRVLVGIGTSGCLMAAFKAYADVLPSEKLPFVYGLQCLSGGIGGMVATVPASFAISAIGWRGTFLLLAAAVAVISASIWFVPPRGEVHRTPESSSGMSEMLKEMLALVRDRKFWMIAPIASAAQATGFTYTFLWLGPWLRDVAGFGGADTARYLLYASIGGAAGSFLNGVFAAFLKGRNLMSWEQFYIAAGVCQAAAYSLICVINSAAAAPLWPIALFLAPMTLISFSITAVVYKGHEAGRAMSLLNFMIFFAGFVFQWFVGLVLNLYPVTVTDTVHFAPEGYRMSLGIIVAISWLSVIYCFFSMRRRRLL
jgi:predicted MFS family arabinose efflux permease